MEFFPDVVATSLKIYALMTPPAVLSAFLGGTKHMDKKQKLTVATKTSCAIFVIGAVLYLFGPHIFSLFGFTLDAFRIGAGVLLFLTAVSLMNDNGSHTLSPEEGDISVVPLAIPLGMGPASIGAVMVMGATAVNADKVLTGIFSLFIAALGMFVLLVMAEPLARMLSRTGIAVLSKLTGLLLAAIAAQVIFTGVRAFLG